MRTAGRRAAAGLLGLLLLSGEAARADLFTATDALFSRPRLVAGNLDLYTFTPNVSTQKPWIARELARQRPGRFTPDASASPDVSSAYAVASGFSPDYGVDALAAIDAAASEGGTDDPGGLAGGALARLIGEGAMVEVDMDELLANVPGVALAVADALTGFTDATMRLALSVRRFLGGHGFDWTDVFRNRKSLSSEKAEAIARTAARAPSKDEEIEDPHQKGAKVKKVVRSAFKIFLGFGLGLFLWLLVCRM